MIKPIALLGLPGCGKTFWGNALAKNLTIPFFDLDSLITKQSGLTIPEIFHEGGEALFRSIESSTLFELCTNTMDEAFVLSLGGGTPSFNNNMQVVNNCCTSIYLSMNVKQICTNLTNDKENHRPLVKKSTGVELMQFIEKLLAERKSAYELADYMLVDDEISISNFKKIIKDIK